MSWQSNTKNFIEKAKKVHGDKYDYSLVCYQKSSKKVKIICSKHGEFEQSPNAHLSNKGCSKCRGSNTDKFVEKAKKIHGDKYDYSLVDYKHNRIKIKIICNIHGAFYQEPNCHLNGCGCQKCGKCSTTNEFIKNSKEKHGNKYDYSLVDYKDSITPVKIICKKHGIFKQKPVIHLNCNCPKCSKEKSKSSNKEFINKAKKVHGDKYDYSLVDYNGARDKVKIICPIHGMFEQTPDNHKRGKGCPICKESYGEKKIRMFLKNNKINYTRQHNFENCKYERLLHFDFYLIDLNICIEYDGEQHINEKHYFNTKNNFEKSQIRDKIKTDYCLSNNIELIIIATFTINILTITSN